MNTGILDDIAKRLAAAVPPGAQDLKSDLEKNFRAVLQGNLERLDLVTREEFEVQAQVLARTRQKLEALESRVTELEGKEEA